MNYDDLNGFALHNVVRKNVILGKNGCGKSYLLKQVEDALRKRPDVGRVRYISPERAGNLRYEPNIDQNITSNPEWMDSSRRNNQVAQFKEQSAVLFRRLEMLFLRQLQEDHIKPDYVARHFDEVIAKINKLLDRVAIRSISTGFEIYEKQSGNPARPELISSGESELISLAIEFLAFKNECDQEKVNFLLIDEPDVHLHPDLQHRLAIFISEEVSDETLIIILATHSTPLLSSLATAERTTVAFMRSGDYELVFKNVSEIVERVLPIFGAHPLSNVFNDSPILLVEGEDDERIWQQAVRSSQGRIKLYPCVTDSVDRQNLFEVQANEIIQAVYDDARGYSLRDRDNNPEEIEDLGQVIRMRLHCRAAENLMLSDDSLNLAGTNWAEMQDRIRSFVEEFPHHPYYAHVKKFLEDGLDRKGADLKEIRNVLIGLMTNKPWEVLIGQAIAKLVNEQGILSGDSLSVYLGAKTCQHLLNWKQLDNTATDAMT